MSMGKTSKCNLRGDEALAEFVKIYQCFSDKCFPG